METTPSTASKLSPSAAITPPLKFLDTEQCAARYGFSAEHWRRLVDAGKAPLPRRFDRLVRWATADLDAWDTDGNLPLRPVNRNLKPSKGGQR